MMDIKQGDIFELIDAYHDDIEDKYEQLCDTILIQVPTLGLQTGIGSNKKFSAGGIPWRKLKVFAFDLIEKGLINVIHYRDS